MLALLLRRPWSRPIQIYCLYLFGACSALFYSKCCLKSCRVHKPAVSRVSAENGTWMNWYFLKLCGEPTSLSCELISGFLISTYLTIKVNITDQHVTCMSPTPFPGAQNISVLAILLAILGTSKDLVPRTISMFRALSTGMIRSSLSKASCCLAVWLHGLQSREGASPCPHCRFLGLKGQANFWGHGQGMAKIYPHGVDSSWDKGPPLVAPGSSHKSSLAEGDCWACIRMRPSKYLSITH